MLKLREEATAIYRKKYGPKHPHAAAQHRRAWPKTIPAGRHEESAKLVDEALAAYDGTSFERSNPITRLISARFAQFQKAKDVAGRRATAEMWERSKYTDSVSLYNAACYRAETAALAQTPRRTPPGLRRQTTSGPWNFSLKPSRLDSAMPI